MPIEPLELTAPFSPRIYLLRGLIWFFTGIFLAGLAATTIQTDSREARPVARGSNAPKRVAGRTMEKAH